MAVKVVKRNGDIQVIPNAEFLPAFYFIPEKVLKKCGNADPGRRNKHCGVV